MEVLLNSDNNNGHTTWMWAGSSVGIATELWAERYGIESRWGWDFPPVQTGLGTHPASCKMGTGYFPGVKCGRGVLLILHPLLVPRSWKNRAIPLPTTHPMGHTGPVTATLYLTVRKHLRTFMIIICSEQCFFLVLLFHCRPINT